jgi:hypothetical protein
MKPLAVLGIAVLLCVGSLQGQDSKKPSATDAPKVEKETRYLAFQIFTCGPDPKIPMSGQGMKPLGNLPGKAVLRDYIGDIKERIGTIGGQETRLAVVLGQLCFDHDDDEITKFIELGFNLALETDVAVGFHIDDSMFWARRKDLWSDPKNVEALDWDGTPCTGRRLDWETGPGAKPEAAPPQMCFNSKAIQKEVQKRATLLGQAIQAGEKLLRERRKPELFAGVIAGSETMIGQDFKTNKYLGYRALINRGFSRERPPADLDLEREKVVQEFIELWTKGLADAGVSTKKIYSHTAFLSRRTFKLSGNKESMYSQHNHFASPSVAFGKYHRPGFSTYPQPGIFDDIYEQLASHKQLGWASCEGTNLQLGSGPGQSGMTMETYLAKMFNHGATLVNIFSWGIGGEAHKNMSFRVVTEGEEALKAYRKFLKGEALIEAKAETLTLLERLPPKIHKIQKELPAWVQKNGNKEVAALMQELDKQMKAKNFEEVEKTADAILKLMGLNEPVPEQDVPEESRRQLTHNLGSAFLVFRVKVQEELKLTKEQKEKLEQQLRELLPDAMQFLQKINGLKPGEREKELGAFRPKAREKMAAVQKETLNEDQRTRLRQLEMQREGLFGDGEIWKELEVTNEQRAQFLAAIMPMQKKIMALLEEVQKGGKADEIRPKILKIRQDLQVQLEALLTDAQKKRWKEMLGKPVDLSVLFDDVSSK